jgi:CRISPR system Cascade subunit CasE
MTRGLFLTRVTLRRDAPIAALRAVFLPDDEEQRTMVGHRLIWTLFGDSPERKRDFLWREAGDGKFYTLSERAPHDHHNVFHIDPPKPFAPAFQEGDQLRFSLRANATVARRTDGAKRGKPSDVVMDALHGIPKGRERAIHRTEAVQTAGLQWLARQSEKCGFTIAPDGNGDATAGARVTSYRAMQLDHRHAAMKIGVLDYDGELTVTDPAVFVSSIADGFGRAKAFGCGLMLVRRV